MGQFVFTRRGEVQERRVRINRVEKEVKQENRWHYFTTREVQKILCNAGISVSLATVRHWVQRRILPAHKRGVRKRWWVTQNGFKIFIEIMHYYNEKEIEFENDPLDLRYDVQPKVRQKRPRPGYRGWPRNRDGTFKKKQQYNHREMYGRLG